MSSIDNPVLPNETAALIAEMRQRLIHKSHTGATAGLLKKAPAASAAPAFVSVMPVTALQPSSKSIFDPFSGQKHLVPSAQPHAALPIVDVPIVPVVEARPAPVVGPAAYVPQENALKRYSSSVYTAVCLAATLLGVGTVYNSNAKFAGEMYGSAPMTAAAEAFSKGKNYATFDLNINIRQLRDQHIARMTKTPDVAIFGASHWQEANEELVTNQDFYNAHIHRDYWEDMFAMTKIFEQHNRLPKKIIISVRDNLFMPIEARKDFLWEPGIPYWRAQAAVMGIATEKWWTSFSWQRLRERMSLAMLFNNMTRWLNAADLPHETTQAKFKTLDVLLPGGSIVWSQDHDDFFTQERARSEALSFADFKRVNPPIVEQRGVENFEKLITYLQGKGVTVYFVQPPFNPIYWERVQGSAYSEKLKKFEAMTADIAKRHNIETIGSFNPAKVGCTSKQFIDAEHSNAACLSTIFNQFMALDAQKTKGN
jgi:hypothetical protein